MLIFYGRRTARIKRYTDHQQSCTSCRSFDFNVTVYRGYYHLYLIPIIPIGDKTVEVRCKDCTEPLRLEHIQKHYAQITRTPFFLYSGLFLVAAAILLLLYSVQKDKQHNIQFVSNPKVGDVYRMKTVENGSSSYYFLRVNAVNGDTVCVYHNNFEYNQITSAFNNEDFFVQAASFCIIKSKLREMLDKSEINTVEREYDDYKGFNRIR